MLAPFLLLFVSFAIASQNSTPPQFESLVSSSKFIFKGRVLKLNATTMPENIKATDRTVIVKVEDVIFAPETLDDFTGHEITVLLIKPGSVKAGEVSLFFTNAGLYGRGLAVREVGRIDAGGSADAIRRRVSEVKQRGADQTLRQRLAQAELVIVGTVSLTRPAPEPSRRSAHISEHEPDWGEALIRVESVLKGRPLGADVVVLYPQSVDVMWYWSPKPSKGQRGIWILSREKRPGLQIEGLTALDPLDLQPAEQAERIKRLISGTR